MSLATEVELIRRVPLFSAIGPAKQKLLCFSSDRLTFEAGQVMFREGDAADDEYSGSDEGGDQSFAPAAPTGK